MQHREFSNALLPANVQTGKSYTVPRMVPLPVASLSLELRSRRGTDFCRFLCFRSGRSRTASGRPRAYRTKSAILSADCSSSRSL